MTMPKQGEVRTEPIVYEVHAPGVVWENNNVVLVPDAEALTRSDILFWAALGYRLALQINISIPRAVHLRRTLAYLLFINI